MGFMFIFFATFTALPNTLTTRLFTSIGKTTSFKSSSFVSEAPQELITINSINYLNYTFLFGYEEDPNQLKLHHDFTSRENSFSYIGEPKDIYTSIVLRGIFNKTTLTFKVDSDEDIFEQDFDLPEKKLSTSQYQI